MITTLVGVYVLIVSDLGFGTFGDYLVCFFWGFGLSAAADQLMKQTTGTVATALSAK